MQDRVIKNIAIHHSGGLGSDNFASTRHLTVVDINRAHKERWNFPSGYMKAKDGSPFYVGYSAIYDPKSREFTQCRAIGEETAAQYGHNFDTFSLCIIGNYNRRPLSNPSMPVDSLTLENEKDIVEFLHDLLEGNKRGLIESIRGRLDLSISRVYAHRFFGQTDCYGSFIKEDHFRELLIAYKPVPIPVPENSTISTSTVALSERGELAAMLLKIIAIISDMLAKLNRPPLGGADRSCEGRFTT